MIKQREDDNVAKVVLYIAMSLDGYIADIDGQVEWLEGDGSDRDNNGTYQNFIEGVKTVILGHSTYYQVANELSVGEWPYEDKMSYVLTHRKLENQSNIVFTDEPIVDLVHHLKGQGGDGDIWLCGGASIVNQALEQQLIDEFRITVIPTILGEGIPLFNQTHKTLLSLVETHTYNGMVELVYKKRREVI